jgi:hypothetical protein
VESPIEVIEGRGIVVLDETTVPPKNPHRFAIIEVDRFLFALRVCAATTVHSGQRPSAARVGLVDVESCGIRCRERQGVVS